MKSGKYDIGKLTFSASPKIGPNHVPFFQDIHAYRVTGHLKTSKPQCYLTDCLCFKKSR